MINEYNLNLNKVVQANKVINLICAEIPHSDLEFWSLVRVEGKTKSIPENGGIVKISYISHENPVDNNREEKGHKLFSVEYSISKEEADKYLSKLHDFLAINAQVKDFFVDGEYITNELLQNVKKQISQSTEGTPLEQIVKEHRG